MHFLHSNIPPTKTEHGTFTDAFYELIPNATALDIAVGYITADSLIELQKLIELNNLQKINLTIGMHYLDRFTKIEYNAAMALNEYLMQNGKGEVRLVTPFRYHGKLYSYSNERGPFAGIVGSNNLSSIIESNNRIYESAVLVNDPNLATDLYNFIRQLVQTATENISLLDIRNFNEQNPLLEDHENVKKVTPAQLAECLACKTSLQFDIPIKTYEVSPQSNLNHINMEKIMLIKHEYNRTRDYRHGGKAL